LSFKAYAQNIEAKTGKSLKEYYTMAEQLGFIKGDKIVASHAQMLGWLKGDLKIGHVYANMIITYFKLLTHDPKISENMKSWAYTTGYQESE
jgi:hypothetical protein